MFSAVGTAEAHGLSCPENGDDPARDSKCGREWACAPAVRVVAWGMFRGRFLIAPIAVCFLCTASPAQAWSPRLEVDDDVWLQLGFLGQWRFESARGLAGVENDSWTREFFIRRSRVLVMGSLHPKTRFFAATDVPDTGRADVPNETIWNAAFIDIAFLPQFKVKIGRILVPFSVENRSSSASLLGIDYNLASIKVPTLMRGAAWRADGIESRGILFEGRLDYRVALLQGFPRPPLEDVEFRWGARTLRYAGMMTVNLGDAQPGWFFDLNSLGSFDMLSFGGGVDIIPSRIVSEDYSLAVSLFAFLEQPLGQGRVNAACSLYRWMGYAWAHGFEGTTMAAQLGYLIPGEIFGGRWQPVVRFQHQNEQETDNAWNTFNLGLNFFLVGHNVNLKVDLALNEKGADERETEVFRFQAQIRF